MKSSEQAYADTLPPELKEAIAAHEVLVGMNHRMVLAALGAPENKMREQQSGDANGAKYEEWIYGHVPQTIRFVRFVGDRVTVVEIAELGKPIVIHDRDEMGGYNAPPNTREVALGDKQPAAQEKIPALGSAIITHAGEAAPADGPNKVQFRIATRRLVTRRRKLRLFLLRRPIRCRCRHQLQRCLRAERHRCQIHDRAAIIRCRVNLKQSLDRSSSQADFPVVNPGISLREVQDDSILLAPAGEAVDLNIRRVSRNICTRENKHYG